MGNIAEQKLSGPELRAMIEELHQLSANPTLAQIQDALAKRGIEASLMAARSVKRKNFEDYLREIARAKEMGRLVAEAGSDPESRTDAAVVMLAEQITDQILRARMEGRDLDADTLEKTVLNVTRLTASMRDGRKLKADLALRDEQIAKLKQSIQLARFDAAKAVVEHAREIKLVVADKSLDAQARTERVAKILWGEKPADFRPVADKGEKSDG